MYSNGAMLAPMVDPHRQGVAGVVRLVQTVLGVTSRPCLNIDRLGTL
jgi:hypothetical protein